MEGDCDFLTGLDPQHVARDLVDDRFVKNAMAKEGGPEQFGAVDLADPWQREEVIEI